MSAHICRWGVHFALSRAASATAMGCGDSQCILYEQDRMAQELGKVCPCKCNIDKAYKASMVSQEGVQEQSPSVLHKGTI
jgi:hypothetical protein